MSNWPELRRPEKNRRTAHNGPVRLPGGAVDVRLCERIEPIEECIQVNCRQGKRGRYSWYCGMPVHSQHLFVVAVRQLLAFNVHDMFTAYVPTRLNACFMPMYSRCPIASKSLIGLSGDMGNARVTPLVLTRGRSLPLLRSSTLSNIRHQTSRQQQWSDTNDAKFTRRPIERIIDEFQLEPLQSIRRHPALSSGAN